MNVTINCEIWSDHSTHDLWVAGLVLACVEELPHAPPDVVHKDDVSAVGVVNFDSAFVDLDHDVILSVCRIAAYTELLDLREVARCDLVLQVTELLLCVTDGIGDSEPAEEISDVVFAPEHPIFCAIRLILYRVHHGLRVIYCSLLGILFLRMFLILPSAFLFLSFQLCLQLVDCIFQFRQTGRVISFLQLSWKAFECEFWKLRSEGPGRNGLSVREGGEKGKGSECSHRLIVFLDLSYG
jgi:hypothetical protein